MKRYGRPEVIVTDLLRSYPAAMKLIGIAERQGMGRWKNNRAENSHQPFRRRERAIGKFRSVKPRQKFTSVRSSVHNRFNQERYLHSRQDFNANRSVAPAKLRLESAGGRKFPARRLSSDSTVRSVSTKTALPPSSLTISELSAPVLASISTQATAVPSRANNRLAALPTPDAAPLMIAFFPSSRFIGIPPRANHEIVLCAAVRNSPDDMPNPFRSVDGFIPRMTPCAIAGLTGWD